MAAFLQQTMKPTVKHLLKVSRSSILGVQHGFFVSWTYATEIVWRYAVIEKTIENGSS